MANTVIALKKSATPSATPGSLANGELAINYADGIIYYKAANGTIASISSGTPSFGTISANGTLLIADQVNDILTINPGDNITIVGDAVNDKLTINANLSAANSWTNTVGTAGNNYTNSVGAAGNTYATTMDTAGNNYSVAIGASANSWANTKLSNSTVTLAGSLTTTGQITSNGYIYITPGDGSVEGGEIQIAGASNYVGWIVDSYQNNYRTFVRTNPGLANVVYFHANAGTIRMGVNKSGPEYTVDVAGDVNISGTFRINGTPLATGAVDLVPANNWANTLATAGNNYTNSVGSSSNSWANAVGTAGNNYTISVGAAANNWANTKLSNTSNVWFAGNLNISQDLSIGRNLTNVTQLVFNTGTNITPTQPGALTWSQDDSTLHFDADTPGNVVLHIGQDVAYYVKNQTGGTINKGNVCMFTGTLGASGRITVGRAIANNSYPSKYIVGVAAEDITNGADGYVISQGRVRGINTSMFSQGDILYVSASNPGGYSNVMPTAPNNKVTIASVIHSDATLGAIEVRPTFGSKINEDELAELSGLADGDLLRYKSANGRFENFNENSTGPAINAAAAFAKANSANVLAYQTGIGANAWANAIATAGNNYTNSVGTAGNNYSISVGASSNAWANTVGTAGNNYTNSVGVAGNNYTNAVGTSSNNASTARDTAGNNYSISVGASSNAYTNAVGTAGNNYTNAVGTSSNNASTARDTAGNNYSISIGASSNAWTNAVATAGNNYTNSVRTAGNNYTITVAASANNWANTKLANTTGAIFNGNLIVSGAISLSTIPIVETVATISTNYTISTGYNGMTAGPITIAAGVTVTVPSGSTWTIV